MIRVMLVDDHPVVREGCHRLLEQAGDIEVCAVQVSSADEAYAAWRGPARHLRHRPVAAGHRRAGVAAPPALRDPRARVLVFSMRDSTSLVRRALSTAPAGS